MAPISPYPSRHGVLGGGGFALPTLSNMPRRDLALTPRRECNPHLAAITRQGACLQYPPGLLASCAAARAHARAAPRVSRLAVKLVARVTARSGIPQRLFSLGVWREDGTGRFLRPRQMTARGWCCLSWRAERQCIPLALPASYLVQYLGILRVGGEACGGCWASGDQMGIFAGWACCCLHSDTGKRASLRGPRDGCLSSFALHAYRQRDGQH